MQICYQLLQTRPTGDVINFCKPTHPPTTHCSAHPPTHPSIPQPTSNPCSDPKHLRKRKYMLTRVQVLLLDSYDYMMVLVLFQHDGASALQDSFSFLVACGCGGGWCDASRRAARRLHRAGSGWPGHFPAEGRAALSELAWPKVRAPLNAHRHRGPGARVTDLAPARAGSCWSDAGLHWPGATTTCAPYCRWVWSNTGCGRDAAGGIHMRRGSFALAWTLESVYFTIA
jgi:hypothetical protein